MVNLVNLAKRVWCIVVNPVRRLDVHGQPTGLWHQIRTDWKDILHELPGTTWGRFQYEIGHESGLRHLQGCIRFSSAVTLSALFARVASLKDAKAHMENVMMGRKDGYDLWVYCGKEDTRDGSLDAFEWGEGPQQGKRNDFERAWEAIKQDIKPDVYIMQEPKMFRYARAVRDMGDVFRRNRPEKVRWEDKRVIVLWGETQVGKSRLIRDIVGDNLFPCPFNRTTEWMSGYMGETDLLVDDFEGHDDSRWWLRFSDKYPTQQATKGGFTYVEWTTLWITSNTDPKEWFFPNCLNVAPVLRRLDKVIEFKAGETEAVRAALE